MKKILALDLGTTFGFASNKPIIMHGFCSIPKSINKKHAAAKYMAFNDFLHERHNPLNNDQNRISMIAYEDVRRHNGTDAAHVYGGMLAVLQMFSYESGIPLKGFGVGTIKKFWTGSGRANKADMIAEARKRGFDVENDNEADALAILHLAMSEVENERY